MQRKEKKRKENFPVILTTQRTMFSFLVCDFPLEPLVTSCLDYCGCEPSVSPHSNLIAISQGMILIMSFFCYTRKSLEAPSCLLN